MKYSKTVRGVSLVENERKAKKNQMKSNIN
ncbi:hypothetical protein BJV93_001945 [Clostridium butyricum]|jgi:hypothetical protein|nr:hypothetical protein [Clostridium butyricum]